jgi:hypothetical protein
MVFPSEENGVDARIRALRLGKLIMAEGAEIVACSKVQECEEYNRSTDFLRAKFREIRAGALR